MLSITNITQPQDIFREATEMQTFLEANYNSDNPAACVDRGNQLEIYIARSGKLLADAKYWQNHFTNSAIAETLREALSQDKFYSTSVINKKIEALCKEYNYLVNWLDRLNRTATHQLDFLRTILSKLKAEMSFRA